AADFEKIRLIGSGGFGATYQVMYTPAKLQMCIKLVPCTRMSMTDAVVERCVAALANNQFLVKYAYCFATDQAYVSVTEYVEGIDMFKANVVLKTWEYSDMQLVIAQLVLAIEHLHFQGFIHRDIKPANILITKGGRI